MKKTISKTVKKVSKSAPKKAVPVKKVSGMKPKSKGFNPKAYESMHKKVFNLK